MKRIRYRGLVVLFIGLAGMQAACSAATVEEPNAPVRSQILRREIMESQIQPLFLSITSITQTDLEDLISNLSLLEIPASKEKGSSKSPSSAAEPPVLKNHTEGSEAPKPSEPPVGVQPDRPAGQEPKSPEKGSPDPEWLTWIDNTSKPVDPIALGDVLFGTGQKERAERFYQQVLKQTASPEDPDWQWAIYQRANCLRRNNQTEARKLYQELIEKAPSSPWSAAAAAQQTTLAWYESTQAVQIKRFLNDPNSLP